jgi:purine catabolism regulator
MPGGRSNRHAALAAHLRRAGWTLAVTQSDRVVGLAWKPLDLPDLGVGPAVLLAIGEPTPRGELAAAREELDVLVEHGRRMGLRGRLQAEDYLLETLLGRSPRLAARLKEKVLASLSDDDHGELAQTLHTFLRCRFDRTVTSAALHVHRNTLAYRLGRIEEITGLDLGSPRDLACAYMAIGVGVDEPSRQ